LAEFRGFSLQDLAVFAGLFASAFLAATLLPGSSEVTLAGLLAAGKQEPTALVAVATVANVLGSTANWCLGRFFVHYLDRRWFPVTRQSLDRSRLWFSRFGLWTLLFAWVPIIGDPLTVLAGVLRVGLPSFLVLVTIGKLARYLMIVAGISWLT
jgi:membrane protein YqaA with SNARE-associated domain